MHAIHSIHMVNGPNLIIPVPEEYQGMEVKVEVTPVESRKTVSEKADWEEDESLFMELPELSDEMKHLLKDDPTFMQRSVLRYDDPFGPACPLEDWEATS